MTPAPQIVTGHDPRLDAGRAALIAQLDEANAEIERLRGASNTNRSQLIAEIRQRLTGGFTGNDNWTTPHVRALLEEIDDLNSRSDLGVAGLGQPARAV